ncbi:MAG TPA: LysE family transporter [Bacteroidales bacterium]|nr:LysE family transporter [Bacteroidales bacterium]
MTAIIGEGILLGLTLATFFGMGPAFFALVQTSIHRGLLPASILAFGIFFCDALMVFLCLVGAAQIITEPGNQLWFGLASGLILIIFGLVTFNRKPAQPAGENDEALILVSQPRLFTYFAKGFVMNIINPFIWIFWIGVVVGISARYGGQEKELRWFFSGTLLTVLITDLLKSYGAYNIKRFLTPAKIHMLNRIAGVGLIGFGLFVITRVMIDYY